MRLDLFLSDYLGISRKNIKTIIKKEGILVGDKVIFDESFKVNNGDIIKYCNDVIEVSEFDYYILNKPKGYVCSTVDEDGAKSILSLIDSKRSLQIVGRLDKDTTGLIVITNDGELIHSLTSPKKNVFKTYLATFDGECLDEQYIKEEFNKGFLIDGKITLPASFKIISSNLAEIIIQEGRFHQVKKMMNHFGLEVIELNRVKLGNLDLNTLNLKIGEYKKVTLESLLKEV